MENFKQDLDTPNSESNAETDFSRQVEECQSNLCRIEKLFFNLQKDSQKVLRKSQDSLAISLKSSKKKLKSSCLNEQTTLQEIYAKEQFCSNNSVTSEINSSNNRTSSPLTFVVQVPNSIVDDFKKNLTSSELLNFLSECSSKQCMKVHKKKGISSLFRNLFKRKKNNVPLLNSLLLKNMKLIQYLAESNQNDTNVYETSNKSYIDQTTSTDNNFLIENSTNVDLNNNMNLNSHDGQTLVFPINFNSNTNINELVKPNLIIQHDITPTQNSSQYTHTIKIKNEPFHDSQSSPKLVEGISENEKKEFEKLSLDKLQPENSLMKNFIQNLLRSTSNFNDLEILKIFVEVLHEEKVKKKSSCCGACSNTKVSHNKESNFLHNFLHQLMNNLQNKMEPTGKNVQQTPKRQSSKISICSSNAGVSSGEEYFENPFISKSTRMHKIAGRCQSPSLLKYRFCQSEKDIDKTDIKNK